MPVRLVPFAARPNIFDLEVDGTSCWRAPASWWRAQTRESLSAIDRDDLGAPVVKVLAAIEQALPCGLAQVVGELCRAAGLSVDNDYVHDLVRLKTWIEGAVHSTRWEPLLRESLERVLRAVTGKADVSAMVGEIGTPGFDALVDNLACERVRVEMGKGDYEALKERHAHELRLQINIRQQVAESLGLDRMASFEDIVRRARVPDHWQGGWCMWAVDQFVKLAHYLDKRLDKHWLVGGADGGWAQKGEGAADVAIRLLQASDGPQTSTDDDAASVRLQLQKVCAAVLGIRVSEVDADPDVEAVIADVWKAPRRAVPEGLFSRLLADLGAEASRVQGAAPTDLMYSADYKDDTVISRIKECIRNSEVLRRVDPWVERNEVLALMREQGVPPEVDVLPWLRGLLARPVLKTDAADQVRRLQTLVDRQGNELGELRKVVGGPTDLELRRMICQDLVWRSDMIARQEHQIESLRSDLREAEAALRAEHERIAEVSLAAQQEVRRTVERVDDVLSRVVSVENVQRMHDLLGEAVDVDDHVTRLLSRYADLVGGSVSTSQSDPTVSELYWPCPTHGVHSFPSKPCYVCGWKPERLPVREDSSAAAPSAPLKPYAGHVLVALQNLTAIAEYKPTPGATINVTGVPGRGVWVRDDGLQHVPGVLPARLGRTFEFTTPSSARPVTCTWLGEFADYCGVRLAPVYLPNEVPTFDPNVMPTAPLDHPKERESNHTVRGRNNSESAESDLAETLRATRQDAAELETEVARLQGEVDASIECCKERDAWRTWALRGLSDMSDRTDEQLRRAWSDRAAAFAYRCLSQETEERLHHLLGVDNSVHADEAVHQLCEEYTRQRDAVDREVVDAINALRETVKAGDHCNDVELLRWAGEQIVLLQKTDTARLRALWQRLICGPAASTIARVDPELEQQMRQACWPGHEVPLTGLEAPADALSVLRVTVVMHKPRPGDELAHVEVHARGFDGKRDLGMDASLRLRDDDPNHEAIGTVVSDEVLDTLRGVTRTWALRAESDWHSANGGKRRLSERAWQAARTEPEARPKASADEMVDTRMRCSLCAKEWIAWSVLSASLPFECPACHSMSGVPVSPDTT